MPFKFPDEDEPLLQELLKARVLSHEQWEGFRKPETHSLLDVVMNHGEEVDGAAWCEWLVAGHGCTTMMELPSEPESILFNRLPGSVCVALIDAKAFPLIVRHEVLYVAVGRPEIREAWDLARRALDCADVLPLACRPTTLATLETDFKQRVAPALRKLNLYQTNR